MATLDVRGSLKSSKLSSNQYVLFEELISNAIDAYLIRGYLEPSIPEMIIEVTVEFLNTDLFGKLHLNSVTCKDNGCGLGDDQLKAFLTKDTSYKDDLPISGIGKCRGAGRMQFFHHFYELAIESTYQDSDGFKKRYLNYVEPKKEIEAHDFSSTIGIKEEVGTTICLKRLKEFASLHLSREYALSSLFAAAALKKQMLIVFLQRLVSLGKQLGDFKIAFNCSWPDGRIETEVLTGSDLPSVTTESIVSVEEQNPTTGVVLGTFQELKLSHYKLDASQYDLPRSAIAFCAKFSPVKDITARYLRTKTEQNNPTDGFHHIILIEGDFFDRCVNEQRDNFERIPLDIPSEDLYLSESISFSGIYAVIDPIIDQLVSPKEWRKETVIREAIDQFGISEIMLQDTSTRVVWGDSPQSVAERVLKKYQERVIKATSEIYDLKAEIVRLEPDTDEFREKISELSWKFTASLKDFEMANLSQLIVRRAAVVEVLALACNKALEIQQVDNSLRRKDEAIIHSIFFPMRKDSNDVGDHHDIWLLSEEYHYFDYISSDTPLAKILWNGSENLFDSDIDEEFSKLLEKRAKQNKSKRPDLAIFSKEGSAIIVEFKAPGVPMDEHIGDLSEYAHLLAAKSSGRIKKFYGYLIGDTVNTLRLSGNWTPFPTNRGWFQSSPLLDPHTRRPLGETYYEILHFSDIIDRAKKRIAVYQKKLGITLHSN